MFTELLVESNRSAQRGRSCDRIAINLDVMSRRPTIGNISGGISESLQQTT